MSILTAALLGYGGYGKGKQARYQDELQKQYQESQSEYNKGELDIQREAEKQRAAQEAARLKSTGFDQQGTYIPLPGADKLNIPYPVGKNGAQPTPQQLVDYYNKKADIAQGLAAQDPRWGQHAQDYRAAATTQANSYLALDRGQLAQAQIPYLEAKEQRLKDQTKVDYARIQSSVQNALTAARSRRDAASISAGARIQAAQTAATAGITRAGITAEGQQQARVIAGWYGMQGKTADEAARMAVTQVQAAERYAQAQGTQSGTWAAPTWQNPAPLPVQGPQYGAPTYIGPTYVAPNTLQPPPVYRFDPNTGKPLNAGANANTPSPLPTSLDPGTFQAVTANVAAHAKNYRTQQALEAALAQDPRSRQLSPEQRATLIQTWRQSSIGAAPSSIDTTVRAAHGRNEPAAAVAARLRAAGVSDLDIRRALNHGGYSQADAAGATQQFRFPSIPTLPNPG